MQISTYHIDTFTDVRFSGNPAVVCILPSWLSDADLFSIAQENNQPATAFLVRTQDQFSIRWLTPEYELELCGHGTLAASYVIFNYLEPTWKKVALQSTHELLHVSRDNHDLITLNFPATLIEPCSLPLLAKGFGLAPKEVYQYKNERCLAIYETEDEIRQLKPDLDVLKTLEHRGVIVAAPGTKLDFVSRTFYPQKTIYEDPVTGSSHCLLIPYWAKRLNKTHLHTKQISERGGELFCQYQNNRALISGKAVIYQQGTLILNEK